MVISPELLEILACPKCKGSLSNMANPDGFACAQCQLIFKMEDEIPNFIIEEAIPLTDEVEQK